MDFVKNKLDDLSILDERKNGSKMDKRKKIDDETDQEEEDDGGDNGGNEDRKYKSKNLIAERKRRKKLCDRQLELRALVPIITNARTF